MTASPDYSQRVGARFMVGVYLGVNAVRDLYLLVEGPDCVHIKTQYVQGNHDWLSTLTSVSGFHRVANTALHPDYMSGSREPALGQALRNIASHAAVPAVALTSMPMAYVTGADYERLAAEVAEETGKPIVHVPGRSLSRDWLDGYAHVLTALAEQLDLSGGCPDPDRVGVVGYLFDRNEGDHTANLTELERLLSGLGLRQHSVWLGGQGFAELDRIRDCSTIVSLPYGRRAARVIAKRTGARLIETPLPVGLPASEAWLRQIGAALDRSDQAETVIDRELARVVPKLEWVIPYAFQNRNVGYLGDPHLLPGLTSYVRCLGARLRFAVITNRPGHTGELPEPVQELGPLVYPTTRALAGYLAEAQQADAIDLMIGSDLGQVACPVASFELGFPSTTRHALYDRPFLGFGGALALADSWANAMSQHALSQAARDNNGPPDPRRE